MRICLFFTYGNSLQKWARQGILEREIQLYRILTARGLSFAFFTYGDRSELEFAHLLPEIEIIPAYPHGRPTNKVVRFLESFLLPFRFQKKMQSFDIFKTNQMWGAWVPIIAKKLTGAKLLIRCGYDAYLFSLYQKRNGFWKKALWLLSKIAYANCDFIAVSSQEAYESALRNFNAPATKVALLPNFVDTDKFSPSTTNPGNKRILFVGRLHPQKNIFSLISAVAKAKSALDIVGDGILRSDLICHARRLNADVRFFSSVSHELIAELLKKYEVVAAPSFYEGNPKFILEAMSSGKALIASRVDGISEIVIDGVNGLLTGTSDDEIAKSIEVLNASPNLRRELGRNARQAILKSNGISFIAKKEEEIYRRLHENSDQKNTQEHLLQSAYR